MSKIVSIRKVKNDSLQAEMTGTVQKPGSINVLQALNAGDERFQTGSKRRVWFPVTLAFLVDFLSAAELKHIEGMAQGEKLAVEITNPTVNGEILEIQVKESTQPDTYQRANVMNTAKRIMIDESVAANKGLETAYDLSVYKGQNGYFLTEEGQHIFTRSTVTIASQVKHTFVDGTLVPEKELAKVGATLAEPVAFKEVEA
jgi:hypothetical protein